MAADQLTKMPASARQLAKRKKRGQIVYIIPESSLVEILVAAFLAVLVWVGTRLWWSFAPIIVLPIIMGIYVSCLLKRSDFLLVSIIAGLIASLGFPPLGGNKILVGPEVAVTFPMLAKVDLWITLFIVFTIYVSSLVFSYLLERLDKEKLVYVLLALILIGFIVSGSISQATPSPAVFRDVLNIVPQPEKYGWDGLIYLNTFYLMEKGYDYYHAFSKSIIDDARTSAPPSTILGWRLPTIFYAWKLVFNSGSDMALGFLIISVLTGVFGFLAAKEMSSARLALPVASLILGYMFTGAVSMWMPFSEYWGLPALMLAVLLFLRDKHHYAAAASFFSSGIRELFALVLAAGLIISFASRRLRTIAPWALAVFAYASLYAVHYTIVKSMVPNLGARAQWVINGGWELIKNSTSFFTTYMFGSVIQAIAFWAIGLVGLLCVKHLQNKLFLLSAGLAIPAIMWFYGHVYAWYWGISFVPIAYLGFAPLAELALSHNESLGGSYKFTFSYLANSVIAAWRQRAIKEVSKSTPPLSPKELERIAAEKRLLKSLGVGLIGTALIGLLVELLSFYIARIPIQPLVFQIMDAFLVIGLLLIWVARGKWYG